MVQAHGTVHSRLEGKCSKARISRIVKASLKATILCSMLVHVRDRPIVVERILQKVLDQSVFIEIAFSDFD